MLTQVQPNANPGNSSMKTAIKFQLHICKTITLIKFYCFDFFFNRIGRMVLLKFFKLKLHDNTGTLVFSSMAVEATNKSYQCVSNHVVKGFLMQLNFLYASTKS